MKKTFKSFSLIYTGLIVVFLLSGCGGGGIGGSSTNKYLGKLPGMAKKDKEKIKDLKQELKECTDLEESFKLDKELKIFKKEADKAIEDYLVSNPIDNVPFEQKADYQFKINKVWVESSSPYRINYRAKVTITEDIGLNSIGRSKKFFAYVIAVDKEGKSLTRKPGVFGKDWNAKGPFKTNMEVEMYGSLDGPADLVNFEKLVFVSKEDYEEAKKYKPEKNE